MQQLVFEDLLLNPSVLPEDEHRLSRQAEAILRLFIEARQRDELVANTAVMRLAGQYQARIYECRRFLVSHGFCIDLVKHDKGGLNWYGMVPLGESTFYSKHKYAM